MADIISIDQKLKLTRQKRAELLRRRKVQAVQKVFQCAQCAFRCEKCGTQISVAEVNVSRPPKPKPAVRPVDPDRSKPDRSKKGSQEKPRLPYRFCETCKEEYLEYIAKLNGKGDPNCYWHNMDWLEVWRSWIAYHGSVDQYLRSKEFNQLVADIKQHDPPA